jgi:hypothetical protein
MRSGTASPRTSKKPFMRHARTRPRRVSLDEIRARLGEPEAMTKAKILYHIDEHFTDSSPNRRS